MLVSVVSLRPSESLAASERLEPAVLADVLCTTGGGEFYMTPLVEMNGLSASHIAQLSAGEAHVLALTLDGSVFSWGRGDCGQLGHELHGRHSPITGALTLPTHSPPIVSPIEPLTSSAGSHRLVTNKSSSNGTHLRLTTRSPSTAHPHPTFNI